MSQHNDLRIFRPAKAFTLMELLASIAIIALLISILLPALTQARILARSSACLSNQRQIGIAARLYMDDNRGSLFHHHEGWVLDDGSQVDELPTSPEACRGGGAGNSQAEKPWIIFLQAYLMNREVGFCNADPTPRSKKLATNIIEFNGGISDEYENLPPYSEYAIAENKHLNIQSYLLNSVFTHKSARYAVEGVLNGFLTDSAAAGLKNRSLIMFSERNSEALNAGDNNEYGSTCQDDYDTWVGEGALVQWGSGRYGNQGWIRYNRHGKGANYIYEDGHAGLKAWSVARYEQFPDSIVRKPLPTPPQ